MNNLSSLLLEHALDGEKRARLRGQGGQFEPIGRVSCAACAFRGPFEHIHARAEVGSRAAIPAHAAPLAGQTRGEAGLILPIVAERAAIGGIDGGRDTPIAHQARPFRLPLGRVIAAGAEPHHDRCVVKGHAVLSEATSDRPFNGWMESTQENSTHEHDPRGFSRGATSGNAPEGLRPSEPPTGRTFGSVWPPTPAAQPLKGTEPQPVEGATCRSTTCWASAGPPQRSTN